jgi:D-3-phosphoglycerate dehydrogenase
VRGAMKIFLASPLAGAAIERLEQDHDVVAGFADPDRWAELLEDREVVIIRSGVILSAEDMQMTPKLELVVRAGSGFDNIDLPYCGERGIRVVRIPGPSSQAVAEFTIGLILALSRRICEADASVRRGHWPKHQLHGRLIAGKVLGVVGAGHIGKRVGELGALLGMRVLGCVDSNEVEPRPLLASKGITLTDFNTVVQESDVLSIHTPLNDRTHSLIDAAALRRMKRGALLINTSRGGVVDQRAVESALRDGQLAGAALDVHEQEGEGVMSPLAGYRNVILTPHIGGMATESQNLIGERAAQLVRAHSTGRLDDEASDEELLV